MRLTQHINDFRVLEIVQNEEYLTAADTSIIKRRENFEEVNLDSEDLGQLLKIKMICFCNLCI